MIRFLRHPLRERIVPARLCGSTAEAVPEDSFREWAWTAHHRSFMKSWALCAVAYICLLLRDMEGFYQQIAGSMMGVTAVSMAAISFNVMPFMKTSQQQYWARNAIITFSVLQISLTWIITFDSLYPGDSLILVCTYWLDTITNCLVTVPNLVHRSSNTAVADSICFSATVCVPVDAPELVGWQERKAAAHATEEGQQGQLQVLGTARGMCLPVKVTQQPVPCQKPGSSAGLSRVTHEERFIQVCMSVPPDLLTPDSCFNLKLELANASTQLCSRSILLMGSQYTEEVQELKAWALPPRTPDQISTFLDDLAEYLSFQSLVSSSQASSSDTGSSSGFGQGLLPVLKAEAQRSEMKQMMAEVGLELLQHAVGLGMVALADQILAGLLAKPLSIQFDALARGQLPHISQPEQGSAQQQQEQQGPELAKQPPSSSFSPEVQGSCDALLGQSSSAPPTPSLQSQSLLTHALLSYDTRSLACVLEWGRVYGGPRGFAWEWDAVDASGYSPLQIMQRIPSGHPLLTQLLADPTSAPAAEHAQLTSAQIRCSIEVSAGAGTTPSKACQSRAMSSAQSAPSNCPEVKEGGEKAAAGLLVTRSSWEVAAATSRSILKAALKAVGPGFGIQGSVKEDDYRSWGRRSSVGFANVYCSIVALVFFLMGAQSVYEGQPWQAAVLCVYPAPMLLALMASSAKRHQQVYMGAAVLSHWSLLFLFGVGVLPTQVAARLVSLRLDYVVDIVMYCLMEQVQSRALLLNRVAVCIGSTLVYTRLQYRCPLLHALALNLCSLIVGFGLDVYKRSIFLNYHSSSRVSAAGMKKCK